MVLLIPDGSEDGTLPLFGDDAGLARVTVEFVGPDEDA